MPIAKVNGIDLNFKVEGQGKPLLLITGIGLDLGSLDAQSARFGKHFKVIRLDNRGIGKSTKPPGPYSTKMMAEDVVALMDYLQIDKASILGFSMGGMIAQELAIGSPDRLDRLVLCATYSCIDNESGLTTEYGKLSGLPKLKYLLGFLKLVTDSRTKPFRWLLRMIVTSNKSSETGFVGQSAACASHNTLDRLKLIKAPTLVVVGTNDRLIRPRSSEVLAERIPNAKLIRIPGASHLFIVERAEQTYKEIFQFLSYKLNKNETQCECCFQPCGT